MKTARTIMLILVKKKNFKEAVSRAVAVLQAGGVIAYPTETVYGLGALLGRSQAVARLRRLKGKKEPLLVLVSGLKMAKRYVKIDGRARGLMKKFWPGPLSIVLPARPRVPAGMLGRAKGLGVRMSSDRLAQALVQAAGEPLISTSANRSGEKPLPSGRAIKRELGKELDLILEAGIRRGKASTVISLLGPKPVLVREGRIKFNRLKQVDSWPG